MSVKKCNPDPICECINCEVKNGIIWRYCDYHRIKGSCSDCGISYSKFQDMVISNTLWEKINPTYHECAGLLCPTCIVNRLHNIDEWYKANYMISAVEYRSLIDLKTYATYIAVINPKQIGRKIDKLIQKVISYFN